MNRQQILDDIRKNPEVSVLIVGAGINGIGTFRDLSLQGVDVLLVDRGDYCSGASAASSHMVHGGVRYLENGEFRLVHEALTERNRLLLNAPHYVKPMPTTIPIFHWFSGLLNAPLKFLGLLDKPSARGWLVIKLGLIMYDAFASTQRSMPLHRLEGREAALRRRPLLNSKILATATYYDAWMPFPERIALELVLDAEATSDSARALNYVEMVGADADTVTLRDNVSGEELTIRPKIVINAAGPWIDFANARFNRPSRFIGGTKGSHLVLDHPALWEATQGQELFFENKDGRIVLCFPIGDKVLIGTTDIRIDDPDQAACTDKEIDYMLETLEIVFPDIHVERSQIVFSFTGVRPLPASEAGTTGQISRDHSIRAIEAGERGKYPVLSLVGGKWTSFRAFSEEVTDDTLHRLGMRRRVDTRNMPIGGGKGYPRANRQQWMTEKQAQLGVSRELLERLLERYGTRCLEIIHYMQQGDDAPLANVPDYTRRELLFIAERESLVHLDDLLLRRSLLALLGKVDRAGLTEIAEVIAPAMGWTPQQAHDEVERAIEILTTRHHMRFESPALA